MRNLRKLAAAVLSVIMICTAMPAIASPTAVTSISSIPGWTFTSSYSDSGVYLDTSEDALGNASLVMYNNTPAGDEKYGMLVSAATSAIEGHTYILEFDAKLENAQLQNIPTRLSATINWTSQISLMPGPNSYGWTHFKASYTAPKDRDLVVRISANDRVEALWLDNIRLYDVEKPELNLISNSDFEDGVGPATSGGSQGTVSVEYEKEDMLAIGKNITVDGKLDDWAEVDILPVVQRYDMVECEAAQIETGIKFAYDKDNLYFAIIVDGDPVHTSAPTSGYWNGDSVQFAVANPASDTPAMVERGIMYIPEKDTLFTTSSEFTAKFNREGERSVYEVALPWNVDFGINVPDEILFNMIVNQNDGGGRAYCMEISPGISKSKDLTTFNTLYMGKEVGNIMYSIGGQKKILVGNTGNQILKFINRTGEAKTASYVNELTGESGNVSIPAGKSVGVNIKTEGKEKGEIVLRLKLNSDGDEKIIEKPINIVLDYKNVYDEFKARLDGYVAELKELIYKCEAKGITADYENAKFAAITEYVEIVELMKSKNYFDAMEEFDRVLTREYENCKVALNAYLSGKKTPLDVPDLIVADSDFKFDGTTVYGKTINNKGEISERPVFLSGFGHYETAAEKTPLFASMGFNMTVPGGEFESRELLSGAATDYWDYLWYGGRPQVVVTESEDDKCEGRAAINITRAHQDKSAGVTYLRQLVNVEPNTTYHFKVKAKGTNLIKNAVFLQTTRFESWGARLALEPSTDWREYTMTYTTGPDEKKMHCIIAFQTECADFLIDDARLYKDGEEKNLLKNGGLDAEHAKSRYTEEAAELGLIIHQNKVDEWRRYFAMAEQHGMAVDLHMAVLRLPDVIKYSEPIISQVTSGDYIDWPVDNEIVNKFLALWCKVVLEIASEYDCPIKLGMYNEPGMRASANESYYFPKWQEFLVNKYGTIEKLNETYGREYKSFEEVKMPAWKELTPEFYDYRCFNDNFITTMHLNLANAIREDFPDVKLGTKMMAHIRYNGDDRFWNGANYEEVAKFLDINECDAWSTPNDIRTPLTCKMAYYDYQTSLLDAPVWNTENHIAKDGKIMMFDDLSEYYTGADVWNGFIHGMSGDMMWTWDMRDGESVPWSNGFASNSNMALRPADTFEFMRAQLDANRLSYEVKALQDAERKVSIFYSRTAQGYSEDVMQGVIPAYEDVIFSGQKPHWFGETTLKQLHNYDLVIIPKYTNVEAPILEHLKRYIENGGKVLITDSASLRFNEYNKPHDAEILDYIYKNAIVGDVIRETIADMGLSQVQVANAETGEPIDKVEWLATEYNGKMLLSIMNYDRGADFNVKITYNGKEITEFKELRSTEDVKAPVLVKSHQPVLLQFDK